jgi:gamma-glutamyltranspeptidase/glutathione hydrolase
MKKFKLFFSLFLLAPSSFAMPASSSKIMISAPSEYAVAAGKEIYKAGGNVVDVAVGVALTLSVTSPYFAAFGGGGFCLVRMEDQTQALDFRETAPLAASKDMFKDAEASITGGKAVGVPGIPMGLWTLHQKYGKLKWSQLFATAVHLAHSGFQVSGEWVDHTLETKSRFNSSGQKIFLNSQSKSYSPGEIFKQERLARLLEKVSRHGVKAFYEGDAALDIVQAVQKSGGIMTTQDLKNYRARWLEPLHSHFAQYDLELMPPPSSGGVVIATAFQLADKMKLQDQKYLSVGELQGLARLLMAAFYSRNFLGDPEFITNPISFLTSDSYLNQVSSLIKSAKPKNFERDIAKLSDSLKSAEPAHEKTQTTHFSVMDIEGHAVSMTITLNGLYGSGVVSEKYGVALNNEMDDFNTRPGQPNMFGLIQGEANQIAPGKRPLSSMSPTLVLQNNKAIIAIGAPGGPRIISSVFQALYRKLVTHLNIDQAIQAPRLHHQFKPEILYVDAQRFAPETLVALSHQDPVVEESWMGRVYGVSKEFDEKLGRDILQGAYDSRGEGYAGGF